MEDNQEISLVEIFNILKDKIGRIIVFGIVGLAIASVITFVVQSPKYESTADLVVNSQQTQQTGQIDQGTLQTNLTLLNTYESVIRKPVVLQPVIDELGIDMSPAELANLISVSTENNSLMFSIRVRSGSPFLSADIANTAAEKFSDEIENILNIENVSIVTIAQPNETPVAPNIPLNLLLGLVAGLGIGVVWYLVKAMFDRSVTSKQQIEDLGWAVIGEIPELTTEEIEESRFRRASNRRSADTRRRV
ncbi:hypothetical protein AWM75_03225 [Aerococcus urinaehominis]|uniref:Capsular polysaccharide biosynthesis protein CpsC n=1 Tax=Aerococcus urinaehominis TaxID=128944 RepID=A0A0X8FKU3_9LACT|nr:Wzz/FepE/Etk N-terminal domain-containing protein [Aerococcus urinaehominis]AMB99072.1 hypothetical protein AWM75_03225 [Aerococcus urinaehominis]SDM02574.1 Capsular polysaccharide biosynthesis protein [Aerococcus urinaehominis]